MAAAAAAAGDLSVFSARSEAAAPMVGGRGVKAWGTGRAAGRERRGLVWREVEKKGGKGRRGGERVGREGGLERLRD